MFRTMSTTGTNPPPLPIADRFSITINTPDGLRRIAFTLERDTDGVSVQWTITFALSERSDPSQPFGDPIVDLNLFVADNLRDRAQAVANAQGLTPAQTANLTGPAADACVAAKQGTLPESVAEHRLQQTLAIQ
jgi:hypothetical protein